MVYKLRFLFPVLLMLVFAASLVAPSSSQAVNPGANGALMLTGTQFSPLESGLFSFVPFGPNATSAWTPIQTISGGSNQISYAAGSSPNGQQVVYGRYDTGTSGVRNIYRKNSDGSGSETKLTNILSGQGGANQPTYNSTGTQIIYNRFLLPSNRWQIYKMNANGTNNIPLTSAPSGSIDGDWSPNGSRIAYARIPDASPGALGNIYTMNADGSNQQLLTGNIASPVDYAPSWTPDGTAIVFTSLRSGALNIFKVNADGTNLQQMTFYTGATSGAPCANSAGHANRATVSPDGQKIAYLSSLDGTPYLCTMNINGGGHQLHATPGIFNIANISWQPAVANVTLTSQPINPTNSPTASFSFTKDDPSADYMCSLDGGSFTSCNSGVSYSSLSSGQHQFRVRAVNNVGLGPITSYQWDVQLRVPEVTLLTHPPAVTNDTSAQFTFEAEDPSDTFVCSINGAAFTPCASPVNYDDLDDGTHEFRVKGVSPDGEESEPVSWEWTVDTVLPTVSILSGPSGLVSNPDAIFTFTSNESPNVTYQCQFDGGSWGDCSSPASYLGLSDGSHTFAVRAIDQAGNISSPATRSWTIDTVDPVVTITTGPVDGSVTNDDQPEFGFTSDKPGTTFRCRIGSNWYSEDPSSVVWGSWTACNGGTYSPGPLDDGKYTVEVEGTDPAGNSSTDRREFEIDTVAPEVTINSGPPTWSSSSSASLAFVANEADVDFECRIDGGSWQDCTSPQLYTGLSDGSHTFNVRGTDQAGNVSNIDSWNWNIDTTIPNVSITSHPPAISPVNSATFEFTSNEAPNVTYECRLDSGSWQNCSTPRNYTGLSNGGHSFQVRATDRAGNVSPVDSYSWTVDAVIPTVEITSHPPAVTNNPNASFGFTSPDEVTFECRIDGGSWTACVSPETYTGLPEGEHTFQVRAKTASGNLSEPESWNWEIDTTAPTVSITSGPSGTVASSVAEFSFTSNETDVTYECQLDSGAWSDCNSPQEYAGLADGAHQFNVRATDQAGNVSPVASRNWNIDSTVPSVSLDSHPPAVTSSVDASFTFSSPTANVSYECSLDSGAWAACLSPRSYNDLSQGSHNFRVRAKSSTGVTSPPQSWNWTIDFTPPQVSITSGPSGTVNNPNASLSFTADESPVTYQCSLNGSAWEPCSSPTTYNNLPEGDYTFRVRGIDAAGNVSSPVTRSWTYQIPVNPKPKVTIVSGPKNSPATKATFKFRSDTPGSVLQCRLDNGKWQRCSSPKTYKNLKFGLHTFRVRAKSPNGVLGNVQTWSWKVNDNGGKCKISYVRARFFTFMGKNVIRMVSRYKASSKGAVRVRFYLRKKNGKKGPLVGASRTVFSKSGKNFKLFRVAVRRPAKMMHRLRRARHGFVANLTVLNSPGYCKRIFNTNLQLTDKRIVKGQNVWFQRGTFN